ncbi:MAG: hypothetical protein AAB533_02600 [Patescibacteria group bacterium]
MELIHDNKRIKRSDNISQAGFYLHPIKQVILNFIKIRYLLCERFVQVIAVFKREEIHIPAAIFKHLIGIAGCGLNHKHQDDKVFFHILPSYRLPFFKDERPITACLIQKLPIHMTFVLQVLNGLPIYLVAVRDPNNESCFSFGKKILIDAYGFNGNKRFTAPCRHLYANTGIDFPRAGYWPIGILSVFGMSRKRAGNIIASRVFAFIQVFKKLLNVFDHSFLIFFEHVFMRFLSSLKLSTGQS